MLPPLRAMTRSAGSVISWKVDFFFYPPLNPPPSPTVNQPFTLRPLLDGDDRTFEWSGGGGGRGGALATGLQTYYMEFLRLALVFSDAFGSCELSPCVGEVGRFHREQRILMSPKRHHKAAQGVICGRQLSVSLPCTASSQHRTHNLRNLIRQLDSAKNQHF